MEPTESSHLPSSAKRSLRESEYIQQKYREGKLLNLPRRQPLTAAEKMEREQLAQLVASDKPLSEIVIEDRGPH